MLVVGAAVVIGVASCSSDSRHRAFVLLFEEGPAPGERAQAVPVVRRPRHPAPPTPPPTPAEVTQAGTDKKGAATFSTWDDVVRLLPKDEVGNPDWVAALKEKVIAPRASLDPAAPAQEILALDVDLMPKSDPAFAVTFSHQKHGAWLACPNCHTNMFEMKAGATPMTGADVHSDRYCGACHGKVAFDIESGCSLCHLRNLPKDPDGRVDWSRALADKLIAPRAGHGAKSAEQPTLERDVDMTPPAQPALKSVFSHTTHTKWLACSNCHPRIFPMEASTPSTDTVELHSRRYCGACHGSVSFGIIGACGRCHPALQKARQHQDVFDLDVEVTPKSQPSVKTIFSHKTHRWVECASCHSHLFGVTGEATKTTTADLYNGKYCSLCHGKVAADLITQCQRCHATGEPQ